jgi:hypothetical protein
LRGKVGLAANDWLFYGTGGLAYGETKSSTALSCTPGGLFCNPATLGFSGIASEVKVGWAAGAGIAKAFGNWSVGAEYLHMDLGRSSVTATSTTGIDTTTTYTASQRIIEDMVRLNVDYDDPAVHRRRRRSVSDDRGRDRRPALTPRGSLPPHRDRRPGARRLAAACAHAEEGVVLRPMSAYRRPEVSAGTDRAAPGSRPATCRAVEAHEKGVLTM